LENLVLSEKFIRVKNIMGYYTDSRSEMLDFIPSDVKRILEIGCGEGSFCELLKKRRKVYYVGLELNEKVAEKARSYLDEVIVCDANEWINNKDIIDYDLVICNDVLEHMQYPDVFIKKIKEKNKKKFHIVSSLPNIRYIHALIEIVIKKDFLYKKCGVLDYTHLRFFTKKSMIDLFSKNGYEVKKIGGLNKSKGFKWSILEFVLKIINHSDVLYKQYGILACVK